MGGLYWGGVLLFDGADCWMLWTGKKQGEGDLDLPPELPQSCCNNPPARWQSCWRSQNGWQKPHCEEKRNIQEETEFVRAYIFSLSRTAGKTPVGISFKGGLCFGDQIRPGIFGHQSKATGVGKIWGLQEHVNGTPLHTAPRGQQ